MKNLEDNALIQCIFEDNKAAEVVLYERYEKIIGDYLRYKYPTTSDREDDISEILIKIFLNLKSYDSSKSKFKSWAISLANNHMVDRWRKASKYSVSSFSSYKNEAFALNETYSSSLHDIYSSTVSGDFENMNTINYISNQMSPSDYMLLDMKYLQGYDYEEIGKEFNLSSTTISNKVNYLKGKLKRENQSIIFD